MSRQFKFRAWNKASKEMVDFTFGDLKASDSDEDVLLPNDHRLLEHTVIMQYLGADCKDINGIEYCEGDIITNNYACGRLFTVGYGHGVWDAMEITKNNNPRSIQIIDLIRSEGNKIVGNIYENPELLEVK